MHPRRIDDIRVGLIRGFLNKLTGQLLIADTAGQIKLSGTINCFISGTPIARVYRPREAPFSLQR